MSGIGPRLLLVVALALEVCSCSTPVNSMRAGGHAAFYPRPLTDDWSQWLAGEWEGAGESETGQGHGIECVEFVLNGQFLIRRGEATITEITPDQADYLRKNMHASDEEIARFKREGYAAMEILTVDQVTGERLAYLFDSLRCVASGRGSRDGDREVMEWTWATGHKSTRITERIDANTMRVIQRTPMPDGTVMEEKGVSTRRRTSATPK